MKNKNFIFTIEKELKENLILLAKARGANLYELTAEYLEEYAITELKKLKSQEIINKINNYDNNKKNEKNF